MRGNRNWIRAGETEEQARARLSAMRRRVGNPPEVRAKLSAAGKGLKRSAETRGRMSRSRILMLRREGMKRKETKIERIVREALSAADIVFIPEHYIAQVGFVDFWLSQPNVVVECDGAYWHNRPEAKTEDMRRDAVLAKYGVRVLRLAEHWILSADPSQISERIQAFVKKGGDTL